MAVSFQQLTQLYLAYFGRPPDFDGVQFYTSNPNETLQSVAAKFSASPEATRLFGGTFGVNQINQIYRNAFNRDAEPAALLYWSQEVGSGRLAASMLPWAIVVGARDADAVTVNNKITIATAFFNALDTTAEITGYSGDAAAASARAFLATVTSDAATVTSAQANVNAEVAEAVAAGGGSSGGTTGVFTLGTDTIVASSATADLAFNAPTGTMLQTLQTGDRFTGDGKGVLNATLNGTAATPTITNVPTQNYTVLADTTLAAGNITGANTVINVASGSVSGATLTVTGASTDVSYKMSGLGGLNANAASANSTAALTLQGANAIVEDDGLTFGANYSKANVTSAGTAANAVRLEGIAGLTAANSLKVDGAADLTVRYADGDVTAATIATALDASAHTGTLTLRQVDVQTASRDISASEGVDVWQFTGGLDAVTLTVDSGTRIVYSTVEGTSGADQTIALGASAGSSDSVTVELQAIATTDGFDSADLDFTAIENVTIVSSGTLTGTTRNTIDKILIDDNALVTETIKIQGGTALTIDEIDHSSAAARYIVDATGFTAAFTMTDATAGQLATVKLGSGTSVVNLTGGTATDFAVSVETGTGNATIDFGTTGADDDQELVVVTSKTNQTITIDGLDTGDTADVVATAGLDDYIDLSAFESTLVVTNGGTAGAGGTLVAMTSATQFATGTNIGYFDNGDDDIIMIDVNGDGLFSAGTDQQIVLTGITDVGADLAYVLDANGLLWLA